MITGQNITRLNINSVLFMLLSILLTRRSCRVKTFKRRVNGSAQFPVYKWNVQNKKIKIEIYHFSNVRA